MAEPVAIGNNFQGAERLAVVFLSDSVSQIMDRNSNSAVGSFLVFPNIITRVQSNVPAPREAEQYIFISFGSQTEALLYAISLVTMPCATLLVRSMLQHAKLSLYSLTLLFLSFFLSFFLYVSGNYSVLFLSYVEKIMKVFERK